MFFGSFELHLEAHRLVDPGYPWWETGINSREVAEHLVLCDVRFVDREATYCVCTSAFELLTATVMALSGNLGSQVVLIPLGDELLLRYDRSQYPGRMELIGPAQELSCEASWGEVCLGLCRLVVEIEEIFKSHEIDLKRLLSRFPASAVGDGVPPLRVRE